MSTSRGKSKKNRRMKGGDDPTHPDDPSEPPFIGKPMPSDSTHPDEINSNPKTSSLGGRRRSRRRRHRGGSLKYGPFK